MRLGTDVAEKWGGEMWSTRAWQETQVQGWKCHHKQQDKSRCSKWSGCSHPHLDTLWSSRSSSPWSWGSPGRSSMSRTLGPSSSLRWNSPGLCPDSISPNNLQTPEGSWSAWRQSAERRSAPQRVPSSGTSHWSWLKIELLSRKYLCLLLGPTFCHSWPGTVWIPVQPRSAETALCRGGTCDLKFLCVSPVSGPQRSSPSETGLQSNVKNTTLHSCSDQTNMTTTLCPFFFCSFALSLFLCSHLSPSLLSTVQGRRQGLREGRASIVLPPVSCLSLAFLTCVPLVYPLPSLLPSPWRISPAPLRSALPASPGRPLPPHSLKWKARNATTWQASKRLCQGGPAEFSVGRSWGFFFCTH